MPVIQSILSTILVLAPSGIQMSSLPPSPLPLSAAVSSAAALSSVTYSFANRYPVASVNTVYTDNMLLTLAYMAGTVDPTKTLNWETVHAGGEYYLMLNPGQTFAFHDQVLDQYASSLAATTNAHFNSTEGFKSDGWLVGDGVCQLASFINVVAQAAGLSVEAPTNHNFAAIPDVSKEYGVAIYYVPDNHEVSARQNLYITNPFDRPIVFDFSYNQTALNITVKKI